MLSFIMLEDFEGMPVIVRVDRIEHIYQYKEPVEGAEEEDEVKTSIVLLREPDSREDHEEDDEIIVKTPVEDIFKALTNLGDVYVARAVRNEKPEEEI
jgi:hypothetical protein